MDNVKLYVLRIALNVPLAQDARFVRPGSILIIQESALAVLVLALSVVQVQLVANADLATQM